MAMFVCKESCWHCWKDAQYLLGPAQWTWNGPKALGSSSPCLARRIPAALNLAPCPSPAAAGLYSRPHHFKLRVSPQCNATYNFHAHLVVWEEPRIFKSSIGRKADRVRSPFAQIRETKKSHNTKLFLTFAIPTNKMAEDDECKSRRVALHTARSFTSST